MIKKLEEILGGDGTVERCPTVDTTISTAYFIKFVPWQDCGLDYRSYWKTKIINSFPNKNIDYYDHFGTYTATMWVKKTIKDKRREKLKKIYNDNKE